MNGGITMMLVQGAAEYGAVAGQAGGGAASPGVGGGPSPLLSQGLAFLSDNPLALVLVGVTLLFVVALFRTSGYRS